MNCNSQKCNLFHKCPYRDLQSFLCFFTTFLLFYRETNGGVVEMIMFSASLNMHVLDREFPSLIGQESYRSGIECDCT